MDADTTVDEEVTQSDLVHERLRESPISRWVLLDANRYLLAASLSIIVFAVCAVIGFAGFVTVSDPAAPTALVAAIVGGTLPFITIVLAINQLVLSQELGWTGDLRDRFDAMRSFRLEVEDVTGVRVSPAAPADFLQLIVGNLIDTVESLRPVSARNDDSDVAAQIEDFVDAITEEGETVTDALADAKFGTFDALSSVLGHFNGAHLYAARRIRADHAEDLSDGTRATLDELIELLGQLAVARQTFKTLYMQYELAQLSKLLLYVGFPALLGGGLFLLAYEKIVAAIGDPNLLVLVVSTAVTVVFLPFIILLVYTFRIASIASRTADFGPFVPRVDFGD